MHSLKNLSSRFSPLENALHQDLDSLNIEQKKEFAGMALAAGEISLLNENVKGLSFFEKASLLAEDDADTWYRKGCALLNFAIKTKKEKILHLANRCFKHASLLSSNQMEVGSAWGASLLHLGTLTGEHHYYISAKEKIQMALNCSKSLPGQAMAHLYWNYGLIWANLAQHSGEAIDVRLSIQAFQNAKKHLESLPPEFLKDSGNAYLQMGLLVNDSRLYLQAVELLQEAVTLDPLYTEGWITLANAYTQLYINTMDEKYTVKACECYEHLCNSKRSRKQAEYWLGWAQILGESGRLNADEKKLRLSIQKAARGHKVDPNCPFLIYQWAESLSYLGSLTNRLDLLIEAENKILGLQDHSSDDPELWHAYGTCLIAFGQYYSDPDYFDMAIEKLQHGVTLDRTNAEMWHTLGLAHNYNAHLTDDLDLIERSTRFFTKALELKPACPSLQFDAANAWLLSCDLHDNPKDLNQAIFLYESLLQGQKEALLNHPEWLFQYATALEWLGEYTADETHFVRAADLYMHVLLIDPETPKVHFRIAMCFARIGEYAIEAEYYRRAMHYFTLAIRKDEEDDSIWLEWGLACIHLAHYSIEPEVADQYYADAEQKLIRAGQLGNQNAFYNLACLYSILRRYEEAMDFIYKSESACALPAIEEMLEDEWLDNLHNTETFTRFLSHLETKFGNSPTDF